MKKFKSVLFLFAFAFAVLFSAKTYATVSVAQVCYCHNLKSNPETLCFTQSDTGHEKHVSDGKDSAGACPTTPQVPEFGLITGAVAALGGAGSYLVLKRRAA